MRIIPLPSGKEVKEYDYFEWRNRDLKENVKAGIVKNKNKSKSYEIKR